MLAMYYRQYDLPWSPKEEVEARFRRVVRNALIIFAIIGLLIPLLPKPETKNIAPALPERVVNLVLEQRKPPPPPKPLEKKEEPKPKEKIKEEPKPVPDKTEQARKKAQKELSAFDVLKDLRENTALDKAQQAKDLSASVNNTRSERNMITAATGRSSGGINNAGLSRGYGGNTGELGGHNTTQVTSNIGNGAGPEVQRTSGSKKGRRDRSDVLQVLDGNKSSIFSLYNRALRTNPDLQGKVVLDLVISPTGEVLSCKVVSSEIADTELMNKLVARIKSIHFPAQDVEPLELSYPIDFLPAG